MQQNAGLGGACVVTVLRRVDGKTNTIISDEEVKRLTGLEYNPAVEARGFTVKQATKVRSRQQSDWVLKSDKKESHTSRV